MPTQPPNTCDLAKLMQIEPVPALLVVSGELAHSGKAAICTGPHSCPLGGA